MKDFAGEYRRIFSEIGKTLTSKEGCPESQIAAAEERLGLRVPRALRDYYLVAGRERHFNRIYNRLLPPDEWYVDGGHLVFLEENQVVVCWGVRTTRTPAVDPRVFQGVVAEPIEWHREHDRCSRFLIVMMHWHGTFGGAMRHSATAPMPLEIVAKLNRGWEFVGEVNAMRAYRRLGQVACFVEWPNPFSRGDEQPPWRVFAGASTKKGLREMAHDLEITWEG